MYEFKDKGLTKNMVHPLLVALKAAGKDVPAQAPRDHHHQVLTNAERLALAEWILESAVNKVQKPAALWALDGSSKKKRK